MAGEPVIEARDLRKWYPVRGRRLASLLMRHEPEFLKAIDGVTLAIRPGEVLGLAGESGSGKSTTGMTLLKLHQPTGGEVHFQGLGLLVNETSRTTFGVPSAGTDCLPESIRGAEPALYRRPKRQRAVVHSLSPRPRSSS